MFYGIIEEKNKFLLLDIDREKLRFTALMYDKEIDVIVPEYDEEGEQTGEHTEKRIVPMFDESTVDEAIKEYADEDIETAYTGDKYLKGFAPKEPETEIQYRIREIRDNLLEQTDKYMISDFPISDEERYQMKLYRQYLRDYTEQNKWWESFPDGFADWRANIEKVDEILKESTQQPEEPEK